MDNIKRILTNVFMFLVVANMILTLVVLLVRFTSGYYFR